MPARKLAEPKRDATRRKLLARALKLFQQRGVEATTMRDIAKAAGLSLGATYYHFPSKDALVFAFYEDTQTELELVALTARGDLRERLGALFHAKLRQVRPYRKMLASIVPRLIDPGDPVSAFSAPSHEVRARSIQIFERALETTKLPRDARALAANALWLGLCAALLLYIHDASPDEARTHGLVDDALDMIVPVLPLLATPPGRMLCDRALAALSRAGIELHTV